MAKQPEIPQPTQAEWLTELANQRPETVIPGFWQSIEENCTQWAREITAGPFWKAADTHLNIWRAEYRAKTGDALLTEVGLPEFKGKGQARIQEKLYHEWVRDRKAQLFLAPGPPIPRLNDLVRNRISCRYMDGVEFLATRLNDLAKEMSLNPNRSRQGRIEGYYAQHVTFVHEVFYRFGGSREAATITCEIQLGTLLSTRMWEAGHAVYEASRGSAEEPEDWQWNPKDSRFVSRQLGHMIHLADGLLVQLREAVEKEPKKGMEDER